MAFVLCQKEKLYVVDRLHVFPQCCLSCNNEKRMTIMLGSLATRLSSPRPDPSESDFCIACEQSLFSQCKKLQVDI